MDYCKAFFPETLTRLKQWVVCREAVKIPIDCHTLAPAKSNNPGTWGSYQEALECVQRGDADYLGFVFNNNDIVGIDIDKGFEENDIFPTKETLDILEHCQHSYIEKSKSGRGYHIFLRGNLPFSGKNNRQGIEIYQESRFFIMTGDVFLFDKLDEYHANQDSIDYIVTKYFDSFVRVNSAGNNVRGNRYYSAEIEYKVDKGNISLQPTYPPISSGCRNQSLTSIAGQLFARGWSSTDVLQELHRANQQACNPPLSDREVYGIVRSIGRYYKE